MRKRCTCLGDTYKYGHNAHCPYNPLNQATAGCLLVALIAFVGVCTIAVLSTIK